MKKSNNYDSGISLLSLIITIIVVIILAAIAISGSYNTVEDAQKAKYESELAGLKYDANLSVQNYKNEGYISTQRSLKEHLEEMGNTTVEEITPNESYKVSRGSATIIVNANGNIAEMSSQKVDLVKNIVADMVADTTITEGSTVATLGYYFTGDEGAAYYEIKSTSDPEDLGRTINLANGLQAKLIIQDKTINAKQFGVLADGITDETARLQYVFDQTRNADCEKILLGKGTYLVSGTLQITSGTYQGKADSKILLKSVIPNSQNSNKCFIHNGTAAATIKLYNLNIELDVQSDAHDHIYLVRLRNTTDSVIDGCHFYTLPTNTCGYCSVDLYSNNKNATINNLTSSFYGVEDAYNSHISVREYVASAVTDTVKITNCHLEKNGVDETIWINGWLGTVRNVEISGCEFSDDGISTSTIWLGANGTNSKVENIKMHDCIINKENYRYIITKIGMAENSTMAGYAKNIQVYNNTYNINSLNSEGLSTSGAVIAVGTQSYTNAETENITISNNTIKSSCEFGTVIRDDSRRFIATAKNTTIMIDKFGSASANGIFLGLASVDNCTITKYDGSGIPYISSSVFKNCRDVSNCTVNVGSRVFVYQNWPSASNHIFTISNCNITSTYNVYSITMKTTETITVNATNTTINNVKDSSISGSGKFYSLYYSDRSSAYSGSDDKKVFLNYNNSPITSTSRFSGDAIVTQTP